MKAWTIQRLIVASFGAILALMIIMAAVAYDRLGRIDRETRAAQSGSTPGLYYSMLLQDAWSDDFLLTEEHVLQPDQGSRQRVGSRLQRSRAEIETLTSDLAAVRIRDARTSFIFEAVTSRPARHRDLSLVSAPSRRE